MVSAVVAQAIYRSLKYRYRQVKCKLYISRPFCGLPTLAVCSIPSIYTIFVSISIYRLYLINIHYLRNISSARYLASDAKKILFSTRCIVLQILKLLSTDKTYTTINIVNERWQSL